MTFALAPNYSSSEHKSILRHWHQRRSQRKYWCAWFITLTRTMYQAGPMLLWEHLVTIPIQPRFNFSLESFLRRPRGKHFQIISILVTYSFLQLNPFNTKHKSTICIPGSEVIPVPLFHTLDGTRSEDYVARVEPSAVGGRKMAEYMLVVIHSSSDARMGGMPTVSAPTNSFIAGRATWAEVGD